MKVAVEMIVVFVIAVMAAGSLLRWRKVNRDHRRERNAPTERRLLTPPPSPYATSKGFRLLDGEDGPLARPAPSRPRLDTDHDYVFSDSLSPLGDDSINASLRRDERWALSRSAHRPKIRVTSWRITAVAVVVLVLLGLVGYEFFGGHSRPSSSTTTSTTTTIASGAPGAIVPSRFVSATESSRWTIALESR